MNVNCKALNLYIFGKESAGYSPLTTISRKTQESLASQDLTRPTKNTPQRHHVTLALKATQSTSLHSKNMHSNVILHSGRGGAVLRGEDSR